MASEPAPFMFCFTVDNQASESRFSTRWRLFCSAKSAHTVGPTSGSPATP